GAQGARHAAEREVNPDHLVAGVDGARGGHGGVDPATHRRQNLHRSSVRGPPAPPGPPAAPRASVVSDIQDCGPQAAVDRTDRGPREANVLNFRNPRAKPIPNEGITVPDSRSSGEE